MPEIRCARCKKKMPEKHYMLQVINYLGPMSRRQDVCDECYNDFIDFMDEVDDMEE